MLKRLRIKNFALIEDLDLLFCPGFNVITGETGAGKSIIIGALNLLFGDRASVEMYREGEEHLIVEGAFEQPRSREELIIRREMYRGGKSYIFINDIQNTLQTLRDTTSGLAELMGQHQHQTLLNQSNHMEILDRFGNLESKLKEFRDSFTKWKSLKLEIGNLKKSRQERTERVDYLKFQLSEIEFAKLSVEGEQELAREREILKNSGKIKDLTSAIYSALYDNDDSVFENVNTVRAQIKELKEIDNKAPFKEEDIESLYILAEEVGKLAADYGNFVEDDPVRLDVVENSLAEIDRLKNKYNKSVAEILEHAQEIQREIDLSDNFDLRIEELKNELTIETENLIELAIQLDNQRKETAVKFSNKLKKALSSMSMGKMDFISRFSESDNSIRMSYNGKEYSVSDNGLSQAEFLISPNPGEGLKPLRKIASGGEISRLMLAIKTAIAEKDNINLLIFDEVDTGIGGEIAVKVGKLLKELAKSHQIICITHLQQIASLSDMHFAVAKKTSRGRTHAFVKHLKGKDRIAEIARLISGDPSSETSLKFARKLLSESESN